MASTPKKPRTLPPPPAQQEPLFFRKTRNPHEDACNFFIRIIQTSTLDDWLAEGLTAPAPEDFYVSVEGILSILKQKYPDQFALLDSDQHKKVLRALRFIVSSLSSGKESNLSSWRERSAIDSMDASTQVLPDFKIEFDPSMTIEERAEALDALNEFYKACGGAGLELNKEIFPEEGS